MTARERAVAFFGTLGLESSGPRVDSLERVITEAQAELADALEKAADTLRDAATAYHFFGKHVAAEAMDIAEKYSREVLRTAGRLS